MVRPVYNQTTTTMATSMLRWIGTSRNVTYCKLIGYYRTFLSDAYPCDDVWKKYCRFKPFDTLVPEPYCVDLLEKFDSEQNLSVIDMEVLMIEALTIKKDRQNLIQNLLFKFRHCQSNVPIRDSINHAVIKCYLKRGWTKELMEMLKERVSYGIFPDQYAACILMDFFLKQKDFKNAAHVAYEVMLQEEFDHPIRNALALVSAVNHYYHNEELHRPEPPVVDENEEVEYIPVKVVHNQYYDDHFDIEDEQFLLGKTLYYLAKEIPDLNKTLSNSLQLLGLGMYNKFKLADEKLPQWGSDLDSTIVNKYLEYLTEAPVRRDEIPHKPPSERTMEDELELTRCTEAEKSIYLINFKAHMDNHKSQFPSLEDVERQVERYAAKVVETNEPTDIEALKNTYGTWTKQRMRLFRKEKRQTEVQKKETEFKEKLEELQKKEELLTYFDNQTKIGMHRPPEQKEVLADEEAEEEEFVEAPGERNVKTATVKKKK